MPELVFYELLHLHLDVFKEEVYLIHETSICFKKDQQTKQRSSMR